MTSLAARPHLRVRAWFVTLAGAFAFLWAHLVEIPGFEWSESESPSCAGFLLGLFNVGLPRFSLVDAGPTDRFRARARC